MNTNQKGDAGNGFMPHLVWDDAWHRIEVSGRARILSPTQYRICRALLTISDPTNISGKMLVFSYRLCSELQTETELSHHLLIKHISDLNARCAAIGVQVCAIRAGYALILFSDI